MSVHEHTSGPLHTVPLILAAAGDVLLNLEAMKKPRIGELG